MLAYVFVCFGYCFVVVVNFLAKLFLLKKNILLYLVQIRNEKRSGADFFLFLFAMDSFENQIISAIKKIRNANRRPDAEKIFKTITKESASNVTLDDIQQKLHEMQSSFKLRNTPDQGLDSFYIKNILVWVFCKFAVYLQSTSS